MLAYFIFFALLFLQHPLRKEIAGNCDTWIALTYSAHTLEVIKSFFTGETVGHPMFPVENPLAYGESAPGMQLIIILFKSLGLNDYWANYWFLTVLLSLTALGIFVFTGNFTSFFPAKLFAGFCFACSNMVFAHIDDPIIIFFFIPALALHYICRYFDSLKFKYLLISSTLAGFEIYFSFYVFFYQFLMILILFFWLAKKNDLRIIESMKLFQLYLLFSFVIAAPNFFYYLNILYNLNFVPDSDSFYIAKAMSFRFIDMLLVLPDNLIYPNIRSFFGLPMHWGHVRHFNFISLLVLSLFVYSMFKWNDKRRILFAFFAVVGIFFACGPVFILGSKKEIFYSPLYLFYKQIPVLKFLRVTIRAYFIFLFAVSVSAALSLEKICQKTKKKHFVIITFFAVNFIENVPFPIKGFDAAITEKVPEIYEIIKNQNISHSLILELPARMDIEFKVEEIVKIKNTKDFILKNKTTPEIHIFNRGVFRNSWDDIFQYNREVIYTNWQNRHKIDSINGINGYLPTPRIIFQYHINNLPDPKSFMFLWESGINFIVWNEFMKIKGDKITIEDLEKSPCVEKIAETAEGSILFRLLKCGDL